MTPTETVKSLSEAGSFAEHKAIRSGAPDAAAPAAAPTPAVETTPAATDPEPAKEATGAEETTTNPTQEKPKRDRSPEGRAKELIAEGRVDEALKIMRDAAQKRAEKAEEELRTLRNRTPEPPAPKPAAEPSKPAETKPVDTDPKPKIADFLKKDGISYEEANQEFAEALLDWRDRQREKETQRQKQEQEVAEIRKSAERKMADARAKYDDFDDIAAKVQLTPAMQQFVLQHDLGMEVAYALGSNPDDLSRISTLPPAVQIAELGIMAHRIASPSSPAAPENPRPPVSKAPAPPRLAPSGSGAPPAKSTAEARSFLEHKALRNGR